MSHNTSLLIKTIHGSTLSFGTSMDWDDHGAYHVDQNGKRSAIWVSSNEIGGTHIALPEMIRLRDWLTQVIDAAGPRPLHPTITKARIADAFGRNDAPIWEHLSDALYELDELKQREAQR